MATSASVAIEAHELEVRATALLKSLKGVADASVAANAAGEIECVRLVPAGIDERQAVRNAQSALMALLGHNVDANSFDVVESLAPRVENGSIKLAGPESSVQVLELKVPTRRNELNEAAKVAFETLRAAQANFHGFQFDGAELVRIGGHQYVVVAVKRAISEACYCGAAPVLGSVGVASARALMNAVGVAAMHAAPNELHTDGERYETLNA